MSDWSEVSVSIKEEDFYGLSRLSKELLRLFECRRSGERLVFLIPEYRLDEIAKYENQETA